MTIKLTFKFLTMKISKRKQNEILDDIINILQQMKSEEENYYIHIDNLKEEIEEQSQNFKYSIEEFNFVLSQIF